MNDFDLSVLQEDFTVWLRSEILTVPALAQMSVILLSFTVSAVIYNHIKASLKSRIRDLPFSFRSKVILQNIRKLIFTSLAAILIFLSTIVMTAEPLLMEASINTAVLKLLIAWILIRLSLQFIKSGFVRNIFAVFIWTAAALSILGLLGHTASALDAFGMDIGEFRLSALLILKATFALAILLYGAIFISGIIERSISNAQDLTPSSRVLLSKVIRVTLVTIALLIGITSAGIDLSLLAVFSGAAGLGVGFGLQKGISNLFSGMLLLMDKSIKPGDVIELESGTYGWVHYMGARYTEIITRDNKSFLVPNEEFITNRVVNWSHGSTLIRVEVNFGVHYESDPHQVKELAEKAASVPERVVGTPEPSCHLVEFGDSSLNFKLLFWIEDAEKGVTNMRGEVMMELWDVFKENNINIPYPQRDIYVKEMP